jgi:hypothetical protein
VKLLCGVYHLLYSNAHCLQRALLRRRTCKRLQLGCCCRRCQQCPMLPGGMIAAGLQDRANTSMHSQHGPDCPHKVNVTSEAVRIAQIVLQREVTPPSNQPTSIRRAGRCFASWNVKVQAARYSGADHLHFVLHSG